MATKFQKLRKSFVGARTALEFTSPHTGIFVGSAESTVEYPDLACLRIPYDVNDTYTWSAETLRAAADWLDNLNGRKK